jgi:NarL family two-component system response regulator LiaR
MFRDTMEVMLIDDHPLVKYGLAACLEETGRFKVSAKTVSLAQAKSFIANCGERAGDKKMPSIIILDIMLGEENGLDFLPFLDEISKARKIKKPPVLVCSVLEDPFLLRSAVDMGIYGYV